MSRLVYRLKTNVLHKYDDVDDVSHTNTPPCRGGEPISLHLGRLSASVNSALQKIGSCQINTFKKQFVLAHSSIRMCWGKVSTSSSSVSMSFIFLAIMDTLPHRQPPAEPRLKPMPPPAGSQHELAFTWLKAITNRIQNCALAF